MQRRVVITGLGVVTSLGTDLATFWNNLQEGRSGVRRIRGFDVSELPCQVGAEVRDFDTAPFFGNSRDAKRADRYIQFSVAASKLAVRQSGADFTSDAANAGLDPERAGVYLGTGVGGLQTIEENQRNFDQRGPSKVSTFAIPMMIGNAAGGIVAMDLGITGPNYCITSACATGTHAIGEAWRTIQSDDADFMIAGGSESALTTLGMAGFCKMRALTKRNDDPGGASRPFDRDRDGFVMGEGAGVVILEEREHALRRGAEILCEVLGYGTSADAFHPTMPHPEGRGARQCMERALRKARVNPGDVDYVNAHGTATPLGDVAETLAIKEVFGEHAFNGLAISSTKSMTGHLLGAAGGVEAAAAAMVLRDGVIPPTINLENADPDCDLDYVPGEARERKVEIALSNSFGFGGTNASLVLGKG